MTMSQTDSTKRLLNVNVGVLGHVDSGKTSLCRVLSTILSTAALDKNPQSQARGITLDLGFSAFLSDAPEALKEHFDAVQFTLVDCPGHASLIRTILGGAQIIDMMILVLDATKGVQKQTAECVVIGETTIASDSDLLVVLNKIDLIPADVREEQLAKIEARVRRRLAHSKFASARFVHVAAAPGGGAGGDVSAQGEPAAVAEAPKGVEQLAALLRSMVRLPDRPGRGSPFYMSVDHCFALRGQGTVLTGTILGGTISVGQMVELPALGVTRKVKSLQAFHRPVTIARQGDRVGVCIPGLDAGSVERGVVAAPGTFRPMSAAVALVRRVRFHHTPCLSGSKLHVTVGHVTTMATAVFFGALELKDLLQREIDNKASSTIDCPSLSATVSDLPSVSMDWSIDFVKQHALAELEDQDKQDGEQRNKAAGTSGARLPPAQFALLSFESPIYCPMGSLIIGSKLDAAPKPHQTNQHTAAAGGGSQGGGGIGCRIAFYGKLLECVGEEGSGTGPERLRRYTLKEKVGTLFRTGPAVHIKDDNGRACVGFTDVYVRDLFRQGTRVADFIGLIVLTEAGDVGKIDSAFGQAAGKVKVVFPAGTTAQVGHKVYLRYRTLTVGGKTQLSQQHLQSSYVAACARPHPAPLDPTLPLPPPSQQQEHAQVQRQKEDITPIEASNEATQQQQSIESSVHNRIREGCIDSLKTEGSVSGKWELAIARGLFTPEENINDYVGWVIETCTGEQGTVAAPFGKAGKCRVKFASEGVALALGDKIWLIDKHV